MQWERSQATSVVPQLKYEVGCLERCTTVTSLRLEAKPGWVAAVWWILCALQPRRSRRAELADLEEQLAAAEARCAAMAKDAGAAEGLARTLALKQHELSLVDNRVKQSSHARLAAEVAAIDEGLAEARETIAQARETKKDAEAKAKALEKEVGNAAKARERQAKENDRKLAEAKQRHRDLVSSAKEAGQRVETLTMEIADSNKEAETLEKSREQLEETAAASAEAADAAQTVAAELRDKYESMSGEVEARRAALKESERAPSARPQTRRTSCLGTFASR
mmetsp:Transcript_69898/g.164489  ORF Transcript_69898/g.164489 Transcript_69898/m.164489 type:complete len:280 (+) Transcript_69898:112-951(+)